MLIALALLVSLASLVCWIIILIDAFQDEIWKGIVGLLCGLYLIYYGLVEFDHPKKWPIVIFAFLGSTLSGILVSMSGLGG